MGIDRSNVSSELLAAQDILKKRREQLAKSRGASSRPSTGTALHGRKSTTPTSPAPTAETHAHGRERAQVTAAAPSPPWDNNDVTTPNYERDNAAALLASYRRAAGVKPARLEVGRHLLNFSWIIPAPILEELEAGETAVTPTSQVEHTAVTSSPQAPEWAGEGVRHYPTLGTALLNSNRRGDWLTSKYQIYLWARWLEVEKGTSGSVNVKELRRILVDRLGWSGRHIRRLLASGDGVFWKRYKNGTLRRRRPGLLAKALELPRLTGQPVIFPLKAMEAAREEFNAQLFASYHSGRNGNPISQDRVKNETGIPARTQRRYCHVAKIERRPGLAVGPVATKERLEEAAAKYGASIFTIIDFQGRYGRKYAKRIARRTPNTYAQPHERAANGRKKSINREIGDHVTMRAHATADIPTDVRYCPDGREAGIASQKHPERAHLYPLPTRPRDYWRHYATVGTW